jgi:hypothetical protein
MAAATADMPPRTLGASTLDGETSLRPKPALADNVLHTLEPPRIFGVVIWEVKRLAGSCQGVDAIAHAWPIWVVRPETLGISRDIVRIRNKNKNKSDTLLTIFVAEMASGARLK